jgi:hypothetical protein
LAQDRGVGNSTQKEGKSGKIPKTTYWLSPKDFADLMKMAKTRPVINYQTKTKSNTISYYLLVQYC